MVEQFLLILFLDVVALDTLTVYRALQNNAENVFVCGLVRGGRRMFSIKVPSSSLH